MGTPLKNPPVYFTVAQVRFNAILKLTDYLPSIQDALRKAGYPAFSTHNSIVIQLTAPDGQPAPKPMPREQFLFANTQQTHCFILGADSLTLQSTDYGTYEQFSTAFLKGLELVHTQVALDFTERIGLRYLDFVLPKPADDLNNYLAPEVRGLGTHLGGNPIHSYTEAFNRLNDVQLRARVVIQEGSLAFPPDLTPQGMEPQQRFAQASGLHAILDTDGFVQGRLMFSLDTVQQKLACIHNVIGTAFRATVTDHALAVWNE
jgi:uncharacterized protein (TIGR04255 family)